MVTFDGCELVKLTFLTRHWFSFLMTDGVILVDPEYLKDRKGRAAVSSS